MKKTSFFVTVIVLSLISFTFGAQIDPQYNYESFMIQFGRTYTGEEKSQHEKIFNENYAQLLE
jgi:hypothetical protein